MTGGGLIIVGAICALTSAQQIETDTALVRVGDVATLECVAGERRQAIAELPLASIGQSRTLSRQALATLVRRRVPALSDVALAGEAEDIIELSQRAHAESRLASNCYRASAPLRTGEVLSEASLEATQCQEASAGSPQAPARYDRLDGVVRARADIAAGDYLGRVVALARPAADTGQDLILRIVAGPVLIEREVEALQTSTRGAIFVRDEDGQSFSVPVAAVRAR